SRPIVSATQWNGPVGTVPAGSTGWNGPSVTEATVANSATLAADNAIAIDERRGCVTALDGITGLVSGGRRDAVRRLEQLAHLAVVVEEQEPVHQPHQPAVVRDRDHGALVPAERLLERV